ncbi:protein-tyrosine phosphatase family protein [Enterovirga aerilata]|uniref:Protein phosphatase n=1 Tax=Enterovirga aerilata TaxID=2730920 RepID=A0A849I6A7_9HYPH|nr:dual specificity protein phosphatase family protein [Enterovirga sp. DB1703]NNM71855.1 protein phosphatase [Enterovirga sp. DB1703]
MTHLTRPAERDDVPRADQQPAPWRPNFSWITDHLAVGGRFPSERAEALAREYAIRAIVDLRSEDRDDEAVLHRHGVALLHLPTDDHQAVSQPMLEDGVAFVRPYLDRGERVLIHCEHGIGRSATLALCVLVERGFDPLEALELSKSRRALISPSPAQYHAWTEWLARFAHANRSNWEIPSFDAFKAIAYRHLQPVT